MTQATGTNLVWRASTTTENYNWIKLLSGAFDTVGFGKHTDTGQIDLTGTTVPLITTPSASYQECGYEIRKLVSTGKPTLYCRVGYGMRTGGNAAGALAYTPILRLQWGAGTDGVGNLSGPTITTGGHVSGVGVYSSEAQIASGRLWYVASDGQNYLSIVLDPTLAASTSRTNCAPCMGYAMERTSDPDTGLFDGGGYTQYNMMTGSYSATTGTGINNLVQGNCYSISNLTSGIAYVSTKTYPQASGSWTSSGAAGTTPIFPMTTLIPNVKAPSAAAVMVYSNDVAPGVTFTASVFGNNRTYVAMYPGGLAETTDLHTFSIALRFCARID